MNCISDDDVPLARDWTADIISLLTLIEQIGTFNLVRAPRLT